MLITTHVVSSISAQGTYYSPGAYETLAHSRYGTTSNVYNT